MDVTREVPKWRAWIRGVRAWIARLPQPAMWIVAAFGIVAIGGFVYYRLAYLPAQPSDVPPLQTATVRKGNLVISASGSGTLIAKDEVNLAFRTAGEVTEILVNVGYLVKKGDLLATVEDADAKIKVARAARTLQELTSAAAVATAQGNTASAQVDLDTAIGHLAYLISPNVYYWEQQIKERQQALDEAQARAAEAPNDKEAQVIVELARNSLDSASKSLGGAQYSYEHTYLKNNFAVTGVDRTSGQGVKYVAGPSEAEILAARAKVAEAQAALAEANYYFTALTGGEVPDDATGSSLTALEQAKLDVEAAQADLDGTSLVASIPGTVMSIDISVGDSVNSSATAATIADLSHPYLEVFLDESDWSHIKTGADAEVNFDILPDEAFAGKVSQVDPGLYTEGNSSVVRAYVELVNMDTSNFSLPLGTTCAVEVISARAENAVLVPVEALHRTDSGQYTAFVMEDGKLKLRVIEIGIQDLLNAEVIAGLEAGDIVSTGITETQ